MCLYYAERSYSNKLAADLTKDILNLSRVSGINRATIKSWIEFFVSCFESELNEAIRNELKDSDEELYDFYQEAKDKPSRAFQKEVEETRRYIRSLETNIIVINNQEQNIFSVKTSNEKIAREILDNKNILEIDGLNWYEDIITTGDVIFLVLGGDRMSWENGLVGIAKVVEEPFDSGYYKRNFKIKVSLNLLLESSLSPDDFYYYPLIKDVINIGPATKGVPNQAINRVPQKACISILRAIMDMFPKTENKLEHIFDGVILDAAKGYVPYLGEINEFNSEKALDSRSIEQEAESDIDEIDQELDTSSEYGNSMNISDITTNIRVEKGFYTVYEIKRKNERKSKLILDSDFQRNLVWKKKQKIELIESVLMGIPLPIFYFNEDRYGNLIVVDGRQRLNSLFEFIDNKFELKNLKVLKKYNGYKFEDLKESLKTKIEDYQIQAHVILPPTDDQVKFHIFDRVNRAGTQLNKQEIRNALYQGESTRLLKEVCASKEFITATDKAFVSNSRMKDRYILLRYLAFEIYFSDLLEKGTFEYKNDLDNLLGKSMEYMNQLSSEEIQKYKDMCEKGLRNTVKILGENAFRLRKGTRKTPINMNVFETIMYLMYRVPESNIDKDYLRKRVNILLNDDVFLDSIGSYRDNLPKIQKRFDLVKDIIKEIHYDK